MPVSVGQSWQMLTGKCSKAGGSCKCRCTALPRTELLGKMPGSGLLLGLCLKRRLYKNSLRKVII